MTIEERLQLLEDERAILQALYTYGHGLDYDLAEEYADIWMEDAVLAWPERPPFEGRGEIMAAFHRHTHAPDVFHKHFMVDPRIVVDGDRATVDCYFARLDNYPDGPEIKSFGRYRDVFVRCDDGKWRFKERRNERESGRPPAVEHD